MCKLHLEADPTCIDCAREITGLEENELAKADLEDMKEEMKSSNNGDYEDEEDEAEKKAYDINEARAKEEKHNI